MQTSRRVPLKIRRTLQKFPDSTEYSVNMRHITWFKAVHRKFRTWIINFYAASYSPSCKFCVSLNSKKALNNNSSRKALHVNMKTADSCYTEATFRKDEQKISASIANPVPIFWDKYSMNHKNFNPLHSCKNMPPTVIAYSEYHTIIPTNKHSQAMHVHIYSDMDWIPSNNCSWTTTLKDTNFTRNKNP